MTAERPDVDGGSDPELFELVELARGLAGASTGYLLRLTAGVPVVGRASGSVGGRTVLVLCTSLCLAEVNGSLKTQGRPIVAATERALLDQLRADSKILTPTAQADGARGPATIQVALSGGNRRGFQIAEETLLGRGPA